VLDGGFDDHGRELVSYLHGDLVCPPAWSDDALAELGRVLRRFHDAAATYVAPANAVWQPWYLRADRPDALVGHGDLGPWNIVVRHGMPVGFIDWELAGPVDHLDEVAQVGWLNVELHADTVVGQRRLPPVEVRARRLRRFVDGYELDAESRGELVTRMVELAARDAGTESERLGGLKIAKSPTSASGGDSAARWRRRSAKWLSEHGDVLVAALRP
jgi:hypothetical protein